VQRHNRRGGCGCKVNMRALPNSFLVGAVKWDIFCTLTFKSECSRLDVAALHGLTWLDLLRVKMRLNQNEWFWFLRPERGEHGGRVHLHALIRVRPVDRGLFLVPKGLLCQAHKVWGKGMTTFRAVEDSLDPAVIYIQKEDSCGADGYESSKTAASSMGIPSPALILRAGLQQSEGNAHTVGVTASGNTLAQSLRSLQSLPKNLLPKRPA